MNNRIKIGSPGWWWQPEAGVFGRGIGVNIFDNLKVPYFVIQMRDGEYFAALLPRNLVSNSQYYDHTYTNCKGDKWEK